MHFRTTVTHKAEKLRGWLVNNHKHWARNEISATGQVLQLRPTLAPPEAAPGHLLTATLSVVGMNTAAAQRLIESEMGVTRATATSASSSDFGVRVQRVSLSNPPNRLKYGNLNLGDFKYSTPEERAKPGGFRYSVAIKSPHLDQTFLAFRIAALKEGVANYVVNPRTPQWEIFNEALTFRLGKMPHMLLEGDLVGEGKVVGGKELRDMKLTDMVLPVIGPGIGYPTNPSATAYRSAIDRLKLTSKEMASWKGQYRKVLVTPLDIEWDVVKLSSGDNPLMLDLSETATGRKVRGLKETFLRMRFTLKEGDPKVVIQELLQRPFNDWFDKP